MTLIGSYTVDKVTTCQVSLLVSLAKLATVVVTFLVRWAVLYWGKKRKNDNLALNESCSAVTM